MRARICLLLALTTTAIACAALAGCGQTGALYLPAKEGEVVSKGPEGVTTTAPTASPGPSDPAAEAARKRAQPATPNPAPQ